ncbi:hypothetical protein RRSWK_06536 [Rhodopirellula sp. SWK7]|nr:hypothetical protein RRSWK_06536 [Rhodopirellula sp. SWK7]
MVAEPQEVSFNDRHQFNDTMVCKSRSGQILLLRVVDNQSSLSPEIHRGYGLTPPAVSKPRRT